MAKAAKWRIIGFLQFKPDTQAGHIGVIFASKRDGFQMARLKNQSFPRRRW
jgi:hypothetical protein